MGIRIGDGASDALFARQQNTPQPTGESDRAQKQAEIQARRETIRDTQTRDRLTQQARVARRDSAEPAFFREDADAPVRAGFGQGSVSIPGSAVRTLRRGLDAGRQLVPTLEEAREEARQDALQRNELQDRPENISPVRPSLGVESFTARNNAANDARLFVNNLNTAADTTATRLRGEEPKPAVQSATVTIGSQSFQLDRNASEGTILNIRV
jgi:hypothetical protein